MGQDRAARRGAPSRIPRSRLDRLPRRSDAAAGPRPGTRRKRADCDGNIATSVSCAAVATASSIDASVCAGMRESSSCGGDRVSPQRSPGPKDWGGRARPRPGPAEWERVRLRAMRARSGGARGSRPRQSAPSTSSLTAAMPVAAAWGEAQTARRGQPWRIVLSGRRIATISDQVLDGPGCTVARSGPARGPAGAARPRPSRASTRLIVPRVDVGRRCSGRQHASIDHPAGGVGRQSSPGPTGGRRVDDPAAHWPEAAARETSRSWAPAWSRWRRRRRLRERRVVRECPRRRRRSARGSADRRQPQEVH